MAAKLKQVEVDAVERLENQVAQLEDKNEALRKRLNAEPALSAEVKRLTEEVERLTEQNNHLSEQLNASDFGASEEALKGQIQLLSSANKRLTAFANTVQSALTMISE